MRQPSVDDSPKDKIKKKGKGKAKATASDDDDAYIEAANGSGEESSGPDSVSEEGLAPEVAELVRQKKAMHKSRYVDDLARMNIHDHPGPLSPILNRPDLNREAAVCGLCGLSHPEAQCFMTESSENLAQYRNILLTHSGDEPLDMRVSKFICVIYGFVS